jgi:hypothetical protein
MVTFIFKSGARTTFSAYFPRWQWITFNAYVAVFFDKVQLAEICSMKINIDFRSYFGCQRTTFFNVIFKGGRLWRMFSSSFDPFSV